MSGEGKLVHMDKTVFQGTWKDGQKVKGKGVFHVAYSNSGPSKETDFKTSGKNAIEYLNFAKENQKKKGYFDYDSSRTILDDYYLMSKKRYSPEK